jgi:superfamily II DNA or RNA helicase
MARVRGTAPQPYTVSLDFSLAYEGTALMFCNCPRYGDAGICKHVAAIVQAADIAGYSATIPGNGRIDLEDSEDFEVRSTEYWDNEPDDDDEYDDSGEFENHGEGIFSKGRLSAFGGSSRKMLPIKSTSGKSTSANGSSVWQRHLAKLKQLRASAPTPAPIAQRKVRKLHFVVDLKRSAQNGTPTVVFLYQEQLKNGNWSVLKRSRATVSELRSMFSEQDSILVEQLLGNGLEEENYRAGISSYNRVVRCILAPSLAAEQLAKLCDSGACSIAKSTDAADLQLTPATFDAGPAWKFQLAWTQQARPKAWIAQGSFVRRDASGREQTLAFEQVLAAYPSGVLVCHNHFALVEPLGPDAIFWMSTLGAEEALVVPDKELEEFVEQFYRSEPSPGMDVPVEARWERVQFAPQPRVQIRKSKIRYHDDLLPTRVSFLYDGITAEATSQESRLADAQSRRLIERDREEELRRIAELSPLGFTQPDYALRQEGDLQVSVRKLPHAVEELTRLGWIVEAEGQLIRRPGNFNISVTSGVDWFDLTVECDFDGIKASLPDLLKAVETGERFVTLGDGTRGMLPEEWLKKYAPIAELGKPEGDSLRFLPSQAMILDAMLAAQPEAKLDAAFRRVRQKLQTFDGVKAIEEPASFQGTLREYQREGLGWLEFLREFGFGGCLADDMGLGKTVQVLALLESIRSSRAKKNTDVGPSLVVAPKSLVFNWADEAARFAPKLKVLNHTGMERASIGDTAGEYDLVLTTYGTLRRDILEFSKIPFHYAILDESQAIKNPSSQSAKVCRLLVARHRLAMTGTPVENHLGDLWSLFEFLNPGMLGRSSQLSLFTGKSRLDADAVEMLARALRPFLLRRTKEQVLKELPEKTEQSLYCEMEPKQRKLYNELRDYYRTLLEKKIQNDGLKKSKIHVLEALLRLRQVACHPALVDKSKAKLPSAKLDALIEQLTEVLEEHHKVLVFSQFTSFLALVKAALDKKEIPYEYLDGQTRDRKACVKRFQEDPECRVFLISLKAGGHGLNLTAADYVFILDPWWNPAVEMQAVDRAHRIGQTKPVFAYRLITRGTVEEKILELQKQKRTLADAVISADENLLRALTAEDLQLLLS